MGRFVRGEASAIQALAGTNPAAGAEVSQTVPASKVWRLHGVTVQLVTDGTAATRRVHIVVDDGTNIIRRWVAQDTQIASLTRNYHVEPYALQPVAVDNEIFVPTSKPVLMAAGYRVRTLTDNLQAADDFGAPILEIEEFDDG